MEGWNTLFARLGCALILKVVRGAMHTKRAEEGEFDINGALADRFAEAS